MLTVISLLIFLVVFLFLTILLLVGGKAGAGAASASGEADMRAEYPEDELNRPLLQRLLSPIWRSLGEWPARLTPQATRRMFAEKLAAAGGFHGLGSAEFLLFWSVIALLIASGCGLTAAMVYQLPGNEALGASLFGFAFGLLLPLLVLSRKIASRRASMQKALPPVLDLMYVSVQAGLSFDSALAKVVEKMKGPLVEEFTRALQEIRMGVTRKTALKGLSDRCALPDVSLFTAALVQADQLGIGIAKVLQVQAENVRTKHRLTVREAAMKAPVKLIFPLVLFIFPALFIVLLGPAVISITRNLLQR